MKKFFIVVGVCLVAIGAVFAQTTNPLPGYVWTFFGPTLGGGWGPPPGSLPGTIDVRACGADATGLSDATAAINTCLSNVGPGGTAFATGKFLILGNITIPGHTALVCGQPFMDQEDTNLSLLSGLPALMLDPAHTISAGGQGSAVDGCLTYRNGMTFPAANASAYAGQAFSDAGFSSFTFRNNVVLGFDSCLRVTGARPIVDRVICDGQGAIHPAVEIANGNTDSGHITRVKIQPVATGNYGQFSSVCSAVTRTGTGFRLGGINFVDEIVSQNFQINQFQIDAGLGGTLWSDFPPPCNVTYANSGGFYFNNSISQFATLNVNSSGIGIKFGGGGGQNSIGRVFLNTIGGDCIVVGAPGVPGGINEIGIINTNIGNISTTNRNCGNNAGAGGGTGHAVNYLDTTIGSIIDIHQGHLQNIATTPYINVPSPVNTQFVPPSEHITSDLVDKSSLYGPVSVSCTGLGSGSCALAVNANSSPFSGQVILSPSGSPASSGNIDITFPYGPPNAGNCRPSYQDGVSFWATTSVVPIMNGISATVHRIRYNNGAALSTGANAYRVNFDCKPQ